MVQPSSVDPGGAQFIFDNGLTASAASVSGQQVIVTTSAQVLGQVYTVTVQNTVTDLLGSGLQLPLSAAFQGFEQSAVLVINEVNAVITGGCDLVELRVVSGGSMNGFQLRERDAFVMTFASLTVETGDTVMVHFTGSSINCPFGTLNETVAKNQYPQAGFVNNYDNSWDWYSSDQGLTSTDNVLTLYGVNGVIQDAVFLSDDPTGSAAPATEGQATIVADAGGWEKIDGGIPPGGFIDDNFNTHAVQDLDATSTSNTGVTIQRITNGDTNTKADWGMAENSWGQLNSN